MTSVMMAACHICLRVQQGSRFCHVCVGLSFFVFCFLFFLFVFFLGGGGGGMFSGSSHTSDLKIGASVATLPGAWRHMVSAVTGWPGVRIL